MNIKYFTNSFNDDFKLDPNNSSLIERSELQEIGNALPSPDDFDTSKRTIGISLYSLYNMLYSLTEMPNIENLHFNIHHNNNIYSKRHEVIKLHPKLLNWFREWNITESQMDDTGYFVIPVGNIFKNNTDFISSLDNMFNVGYIVKKTHELTEWMTLLDFDTIEKITDIECDFSIDENGIKFITSENIRTTNEKIINLVEENAQLNEEDLDKIKNFYFITDVIQIQKDFPKIKIFNKIFLESLTNYKPHIFDLETIMTNKFSIIHENENFVINNINIHEKLDFSLDGDLIEGLTDSKVIQFNKLEKEFINDKIIEGNIEKSAKLIKSRESYIIIKLEYLTSNDIHVAYLLLCNNDHFNSEVYPILIPFNNNFDFSDELYGDLILLSIENSSYVKQDEESMSMSRLGEFVSNVAQDDFVYENDRYLYLGTLYLNDSENETKYLPVYIINSNLTLSDNDNIIADAIKELFIHSDDIDNKDINRLNFPCFIKNVEDKNILILNRDIVELTRILKRRYKEN